MKAAVLTELNAPLQIADVGLTGLRYGQVLVKVLSSGICGSQLQEIAGYKGNKPPHLLGHEGCGIVEERGPGVTCVQPGDKVVMHWRKGAGIESEPPRYIFDGQEITSGRVTTFSEYSICSENRLTPVPADTDDDLCALLGCGLSTAIGTLERDAQLRMGESLLVIGVGGLGCNLINAARIMHADPIYGFDIHDKTWLATRMGAESFANTWTNLRKFMWSHGVAGFDVIIETSGATDAISRGLTLLNPSGRFIMVGQSPPRESATMINARHMFDGDGKTIKATQGGGFQPHMDIRRYVKISSYLSAKTIISHRGRLDQINDAIDEVRKGKAGRIIVTP